METKFRKVKLVGRFLLHFQLFFITKWLCNFNKLFKLITTIPFETHQANNNPFQLQ